MSQDQRPSPVKAVSVASAAPSERGDAASTAPNNGTDSPDAKTEDRSKGKAISPLAALIFLLGCGLGGGGLAALPHLSPGLSLKLFGPVP